MDLEMKRDQESLMDVGCRLTVSDVRENVSCCLCRGILRRAVTINLCLHSFCRKCLLRHLRRSKVCPRCLVLIHPLTPLINIKCDYVLQRLVYKLFPDQFRRELEKQKARCSLTNQTAGSKASIAIAKREFDEDLAIFTGTETVSICLQLQQSSSLSEEMDTQEESSVRYLQCQAAVTIGILKRFIENKLGLGPHLEVKIFYKDNLIADAYTIADVACSYGWAQIEPMLLCYTIVQLSSGLRELYTRVTEPCRNSREEGDRSSGKFSGSVASGTSSSSPSLSSRANLGTSVSTSVCSSGRALLSPSAGNASLGLETKIPRKRGRPPKLKHLSAPLSSISPPSSSSPSPPKKRFRRQENGPGTRQALLPSTGVSAVPGKGVPVDPGGGSGASQVVATGAEVSMQVEGALSEDVGSGFRPADIAEHQALTVSGDATLVSLRNSRLEGGGGGGGTCCDPVDVNRTTDGAAPGSVPLCSPVVDPPGIDRVTGPSEGRSEVTSGQVFGSEFLNVPPPSDQREAASESSGGVVQSTQTVKDTEEYSSNTATTKTRSFLDFAPVVCKEPNKEQKSLDRDGSKEELSSTGGARSEGGNTTGARSNGVSVADTFCPQCGHKEENIEGRTSISSRRCENCLCFSTSITVFINHAQKNNGPEERKGGSSGSLTRQGPVQVGSSGARKLSGETDSVDIVPKVECPDFSKAHGLSRPPEKACVQQCRPAAGQPPADPGDPSRPKTKSNCHPAAAERSTLGHSNGFPSRDRVTDESSPDARAAETLVVVGGGGASWSAAAVDRCTTVSTSTAATGAALNGNNKCVRRQKSLETIIQQLRPRQISPVVMGNVVVVASPRVSMATPPPPPPPPPRVGGGWASLSGGAGLCGSGQRAESVGCRRMVRAAGEGPPNPRPALQTTDNKANSLLRRVLMCSTAGFDVKSRRCCFPSPTKSPAAAAGASSSSAAAPPLDRHPQAAVPFCLLAPSIKRLKTMYDGLDTSRPGGRNSSNGSSSNVSAPNGENRRRPVQRTHPAVIAAPTVREAPGVNAPTAAAPANPPPEASGRASCDVIATTTMTTKRFPAVANGFDAPLELTTKESRDRKWRESSKRSGDGDVLRTSFPLFDNR